MILMLIDLLSTLKLPEGRQICVGFFKVLI